MSYSFIADGKPCTKGRPRLTRGGHAYTPQKTKDAEAALRAQYQGPCFEGPVEVSITFFGNHQLVEINSALWPSKLRGDVDNYAKLTLDALNKVAWADDKQVVVLHAIKADQAV